MDELILQILTVANRPIVHATLATALRSLFGRPYSDFTNIMYGLKNQDKIDFDHECIWRCQPATPCKYRRREIVEAVQVTEYILVNGVADWPLTRDGDRLRLPRTVKEARCGDWIVKDQDSYKIYTDPQFLEQFIPAPKDKA